MSGDTIPLLIAIIALVIMSGFFSSTETAFSCSNKIKLRALASNGNKRAEKVVELIDNNFEKLLTTILVGNNIVNITCATLSTLFFAKIITSGIDSSLVSTIVTTVVVLIFGEITPKFIAKVAPEKTSMLLYPVVKGIYYVLYPFNFVFAGWKFLIGKIFKLKDEEVITEEEILTIVEEAEEDGTIKEEETKLIKSVIEFDDLEVGDILVPRVNMVAVNQNASMESIRKVFDKEGYSRLPVYKDSIDQIVGTIHEKDFYTAYLNGEKNVNKILQNAVYTTEHIKISKLLKQLQNKKIHIAVVLDEYGGTLGLVTLEDILEELVGEIWDEHDEEIKYFKQVNENSYIIDGKMQLADFCELFELKYDEVDEKYEASTISGLIIEMLGEIPAVGKKFSELGLEFEVLKSSVKKVLQVKATKIEVTEEE